ncbi:lipopolysaccharide biosynthesis protein, partial [Campylobacter jejuni]|nr:lipopolysaccharide biosynthesis protein [Campylobacter jejuni]
GAKIGIYNIDFSKMHGIGTPEDLEIFKTINKL